MPPPVTKDGRRQWTLKGIPQEVIDLTRATAKSRGVKMNAWIEAALRDAARPPEEAMQRFLTRWAFIQRKAYRAYITAGFSEEEALRLVGQSTLLHLAQMET